MIDGNGGSEAGAIALRTAVESGAIAPSQLTEGQKALVLRSIEADDAAGQKLTDGAIALFMALSEEYERNLKTAKMADQLAAAVQDSQQRLTGSMQNLFDATGVLSRNAAELGGQFSEGAAVASAVFRSEGYEERLAGIAKRVGVALG